MELFATKIRPFFLRAHAVAPPYQGHVQGHVVGWNKTGTSGQGMLYVDNRGIVGLAGAGERIGSLQGPKSDNARTRADSRAPGQSSVFESGEQQWQEA